MPNVFANDRFVTAHRRHKIAPRPKTLAHEVPFSPCKLPGYVDRALALHLPDDLGHGVFGWD